MIMVEYIGHSFGEWIRDIQTIYPRTIFLEKHPERFVCKIETKDGLHIVGSYNIRSQRRTIFDRRRVSQKPKRQRRQADGVKERVSIPSAVLI